MFAMEIFEHVQEVGCYPNIFIAYRILFTMTELSEVNNGSKRTLCIEKKSLDDIVIDPIILDFASRIVRRKF